MITSHPKKSKFTKLETNDDIDKFEDEDDISDQIPQNQIVTEAEENNKHSGKFRWTQKYILVVLVLVFTLLCIGIIAGYIMHSLFDPSYPTDDESTTSNSDDKYGNIYIRDPECLERKCCKSIDLSNKSANVDCADLLIFDCIFEAAFCEWDCDYTGMKKRNSSFVPTTTRHRVFHGISKGIGEFKEAYTADVFDEDETPEIPTSAHDIQDGSRMISIDDCGVMYESILDWDVAKREFEEFTALNISQLYTTSAPEEDGGRRRRMQDGLISSNDMVQIPSDGGSLSYPDSSVGCITFVSNTGSYSGSSYSYYDYDHICTGTILSPWHILTAGHCCHSGTSGYDFYANWRYYPKIQYYSHISYYSGYTVSSARVYSQWYGAGGYSGGDYNYNFCILTLNPYRHFYHGAYIHVAYNIETYISSVTVASYSHFNTLGYRYDRYSNDYNKGYLIYGWKEYSMSTITTTKFTFSYDAYYHGFGGAPIYHSVDSKLYCVISKFGYSYNECTRITYEKYGDFCRIIGEYGGSYNSYCSSSYNSYY